MGLRLRKTGPNLGPLTDLNKGSLYFATITSQVLEKGDNLGEED